MEFISLGSSTNIGASCYYVGDGKRGLVLDAGADPNFEGPESLPNFQALNGRSVQHAIITHAHHDHIGGLPALHKTHPSVQVHMTEATKTLTNMMLYASARLQRRRYAEGSSLYRPLFEEKDVDDVSKSFLTHPYGDRFYLSASKSEARFYYSGHLLGATGVLFTVGDGLRVFYTSDTNTRSQTIVPGGDYPKKPVDVLIMECTLGADPVAETVTRKGEEKRFLKRLQAVLNRGGTVLLPVFMLGRAQEVLAMLGRFRDEGQIDPNIPIYTAGGLRNVSKIYDDTRKDTPRLDPDFEVYNVKQRFFPRSVKAKRKSLNRPSIHVLSSGMVLENTLSNWVAHQLIENEKHAIFLVGFAKDNLPAGKLLGAVLAGEETVVLDQRIGPKTIACEVDRFRFSGHSNRLDLLNLAKELRPRKLILVHGDEVARGWFVTQLGRTGLDMEILSPAMGEEVREYGKVSQRQLDMEVLSPAMGEVVTL